MFLSNKEEKLMKIKHLFGLAAVTLISCAATKTIKADYITCTLNAGVDLQAAVENGMIRILIPTATGSASSTGTGAWNAGTPLAGVFVANTANVPVVTCPTGANASGKFTFATNGVANYQGNIFYNRATNEEITQATAQTLGSNGFVRYLEFICPYTGTGAIGGSLSGTYDTAFDASYTMSISNMVNPTPINNEQKINQAVTVPAKIQLLQNGYDYTNHTNQANSYLVQNSDVIISAMIQDVLVTATIQEQIMFRVDPVAINTSICGSTTSVASTPLAINYGSPLVGAQVNAAQQLYVNSSASNGYVITMQQDQPMGRSGGACANQGMITAGTQINRDCIPNFGWKNSLNANTAATWTSSDTGFGYRAEVVSGSSSTTAVASIFGAAGTSNYTRLATTNTTDIDNLLTVANNTGITTTTGDTFNICYRLAIDAQNNAGVYDNAITYTIVASF